MELWKILVTIILLQVAFFSGAILMEHSIKSREATYIPITQERVEKIYIESPGPIETTSLTIYGVGIHSNEETGEVVKFNVTRFSGKGEVMLNIDTNSYETDFQSSLRNAKEAVETVRGKEFTSESFSIQTSTPGTIKGSSGSLAAGIGIYSLAEGKEVRKDILIMGVLHRNGDVGPIALLEKKIEISEEKEEIKEVLIPSSQCQEVTSNRIKITCVNSLPEAFNVVTTQ